MANTGAASTHYTIRLESSYLGVCIHSWRGLVMYAGVIQAYQSPREAILLQWTAEGMWDAAGDRHDDSKIYLPGRDMVSNVFQLQDRTQTQWQGSSKSAACSEGDLFTLCKMAPRPLGPSEPQFEVQQGSPHSWVKICNKVLWAISVKRTSVLRNCCGRKAGLPLFHYILDGSGTVC